MHRLILNNPPRVDHFNSDGLDNRRENIRACTASQNMFNRRKQAGSSQFKGVSWYKRHGKWVAKLRCHGKDYFLGYFTDEKEAALAYQAAAKELFGEFARF